MSTHVFSTGLQRKPALKWVVVLLAMELGLFGCQSSEEKSAERLKQGIELFKQGDYNKAQLELRSAIQANASVADAYYYMALVNEKDRQYKSMKENLAQAVMLEPANIPARLKLGSVLLIFNEMDNALSQALEVLKLSGDNLEALSLKAAVLIKQKKTTEALAIIDSVLQKNPQYSTASALKIMLLMEKNALDQAGTLLDSAIAMDANNLELQVLKIQLDAKREDIPAMIKDYERLIELQPENNDIKITLAKIYVLAKQNNDADALLSKLASTHPDDITLKLAYLDFLNAIDKQKATQQLQTYAAASKDKPESVIVFSQWLAATQQMSAAQSLLEKTLQATSAPEIAEKFKLSLAELKFSSKEYDNALQMLDALLIDNSTNQPAKILKAKILVAKKDYDGASELFNKVLWESPELDSVVVMLGQIELLKHDADKADKKFRDALEINPANMDALQPVIKRALEKANNTYADDLLTKAQQFKPDNIALSEQLVRVKLLEKDWLGAKGIIDVLEKNPNAQAAVFFLRAKLAQEQGQYAQAMGGYKKLLADVPTYSDALYSLTQCYEKMQQRSDMIAYLNAFISKNPSVIQAYIIKSQLDFLNKNDADAVSTLKQALTIDKQNVTVYAALAELYLHKNDYKNALSYYQQGLDVLPENDALMFGLAQAYEQAKDFNTAALQYEAALTKNPNLDVAANNLAVLLIEHFEDEVHIARAKVLADRFKNSEQAYFLDTYGWVEVNSGDINKAISILEKVNVMAAEVPVFKYHLGVAYHKQGNNAGAAAQLQEALSLGQKSEQFAESKQAQQLLEKLKITK